MEFNNKLRPAECCSMTDVRAEIDLLDPFIVKLIGLRYQRGLVAAASKTDEATVRAPERFKALLEQARQWVGPLTVKSEHN